MSDSARLSIDLSGTWDYQTAGEDADPLSLPDAWSPMPVPSNWHKAGLPDYAGVVVYRRRFSAEPLPASKTARLIFHGVDYFADVWLNGAYLGSHEGYFQPFAFDVGALLQGENELIVRVNSPSETPREVWPNRKRLIKGILQHHDCRPGSWSYNYGQSENTGGIWNRVELLVTDATYIGSLRVTPVQVTEAIARLHIQAKVVSAANQGLRADLRLYPLADPAAELRQSQDVVLTSGENDIAFVVSLASPHLWWTWDLGSPSLYCAELTLASDERIVDALDDRFGIREVRIDSDWTWYLNGKRFFPRGTNIIPTQWLSEYTPDMIDTDVRLLRECNINAVRVHAHVNRAELYDALDEAGILVWQDFALQWGYQDSDRFSREAARQIRDMVRLHYNHPSIVVWCCHNEPFPANRENLDHVLYAAVKEEDPSRYVDIASDFRFHTYPGWYYGAYQEFSGLPAAPFVSEFGAQALPNVESMRQMFAPPDLWPPNWEKWAYHDFQYHETFRIAKVKMGNSLDEFVASSQSYQARLLKYAIEHYRRNKGKVTGLFQFMFGDCFPAITWAVVDYYRQPKRGYYAMRDAYQPLLASINVRETQVTRGRIVLFEVAVVNDLHQSFPGASLRIQIKDSNGEIVFQDSYTPDVAADAVCRVERPPLEPGFSVWRVPRDGPLGTYVMEVELRDAEGNSLSRNSQEMEVMDIPLSEEWRPLV